VVSGPSGAGKSTVVERILERADDIARAVSVTTRKPRGEEHDGDDYVFVTPGEFARKRDGGMLLEWAEVHGNLYGTRTEEVERELAAGRKVLLEIDVQGGMSVKGKASSAVLIFLLPPSWEMLEKRLRGRGTDSDETIRRRLANAMEEMRLGGRYDYLVVNDDLETCVSQVLGIIGSESLRRERTGFEFNR